MSFISFRNLSRRLLVSLLGSALALCAWAGPFDPPGTEEWRFAFSVKGFQAGAGFRAPAALALDRRAGALYVADSTADAVDAFSLQGIPRFQYGAKQGVSLPIGLAVDRGGHIYVAEEAGGPIKILDAHGEVTTLALPAKEYEEAPKPGRMTIDRDGNLYVVDRANCRIQVFDPAHTLLLTLGGIGEKRGQFKLLQDVAVDRQGRIWALDATGTPVQVFDRQGQYLFGFGARGDGVDALTFPTALYLDRNDQVWVVDRAQHAVKVYSRSGVFLRTFGSYGQGEGMLFHPVDIEGDDSGHLFLLEAGARRLQVFTVLRPHAPFAPLGW